MAAVVDFYVQVDRGKVLRLSERELRTRLGRSKFTGLELVRRHDEVQWRPLHETRMFVEEVPFQGSPVDAARWRVVRRFAMHFGVYLAVNILVSFAAPVFLFWGIAIVTHGARALPSFLALKRDGKIPFLQGSAPTAALQPGAIPPHGPSVSAGWQAPQRNPQPRTRTEPNPAVALPPVSTGDTAPTGVAAWSEGGYEAANPYDPTVGIAAPRSNDIDDRHLKASVRGKLFGEGSAQPVRIGRYRLLDRQGAGGMGVVYRAHDETLDRPVAVKLVRTDNDVAHGAERLQREARAMARLSHPNVVVVHDVGIFEGSVFVAMEYIDGVTLKQWLTEPRPVGDVVSVLVQAAQGMAAAHAAGLVHRDFKPENVMVGLEGVDREGLGRVRVLDFGLAKPADITEDYDTLTRTGTMLGTPRYMAPEQFRGETADPRTDQFSLGVVFHEALFGVHPYEPQDDRPLPRAVMAGKLRAVPPRPDVPPQLVRAIRRAVAHDPADRFESIDALLDAIGPIPQSTDELTSVATAVRRMLAGRTDPQSQRLVQTLDAVQQTLSELDAKVALLASEISIRELDALVQQQRTLIEQRDGTHDAEERDVLDQQVRSLSSRLEGIEQAQKTLQRLRARRQVAENQLRQLHLDLARAQASDADLPDLTEPLQELRFEVEAAQEVEQLLGRPSRAG